MSPQQADPMGVVDSSGFNMKRFLSDMVYSYALPNKQIRKHLELIAHYDESVVDKKVKLFGWLIFLSVLVLVASIVGLVITSDGAGPSVIFVALAVLAGVGLVTTLVFFFRWNSLDIDNERHVAARRVVGMVAADMDPASPIKTTVDFRGVDHKSKFQRKGEVFGWKVEYYEDAWLKLKGRLLDGTSFNLTLIERYQKRSKWKRSASGKSKHKTKIKRAALITLSLKVKEKRYGDLQARQELIKKAIELPPGFGLKKLVARPNLLNLVLQNKGDEVKAELVTHAFASAMLSSYQALNAFKDMEKGAA